MNLNRRSISGLEPEMPVTLYVCNCTRLHEGHNERYTILLYFILLPSLERDL